MADTPTDDNSTSRSATLRDRRRPGRVDYENPHLIALLRSHPAIDPTDAQPDTVPTVPPGDMDNGDALDAAPITLLGTLIVAAISAAIIFTVCLFR